MPAALAPIAGAVVGGLMSDGGGGQQTASKEPWAPAIKPLTNSLNTGQALERYYQQNPFNPMQRTGYQNLFSDLDQFRNQIQPGLAQFSNEMMQSNYQRGPRQSQMEAMQGQMPMQQTKPMMMQQGQDGVYSTKPMQQGGGLLSAMGQAGVSPINPNQSMAGAMQGGNMSYQGSIPQGLLSAIQQGPFQAPTQGNYGLLDWAQLNPFTSTTNGIPKAPEAKPGETDEEKKKRDQEELMRLYMESERRGAGA
ncbi:hypothetical protein J2W88_003914 [Acidovorax delafieldii]|uniref:Uncharacterized protein n=1 Tax=Acidovorax delafieldii TaxID=47920 RepID=A0AAJ2C204_ACIDE|nr:hypothetical protein [Acidovorax delafieldii]MDR6768610.1 hypothetical protein [Acidovorax delafieldii]MDR6837325.1 hypothetical protein [Acidovorax delafieldii]MDR7366816.1 hypothetical protein [Acidovorax delafieldii]